MELPATCPAPCSFSQFLAFRLTEVKGNCSELQDELRKTTVGMGAG